eukprot:4753949-Pleurochrysis_carterae.AAC.1
MVTNFILAWVADQDAGRSAERIPSRRRHLQRPRTLDNKGEPQQRTSGADASERRIRLIQAETVQADAGADENW